MYILRKGVRIKSKPFWALIIVEPRNNNTSIIIHACGSVTVWGVIDGKLTLSTSEQLQTEEHKMYFWEWPNQSLDLNLIEIL